MLTVAYLANQFPSPVEPYVVDEIEALRRRGVAVVASTVRKPITTRPSDSITADIVIQACSPLVLFQGAWGCVRGWKRISSLVCRGVFQGKGTPLQRGKALLHTWLGGCYAVLLKSHRVDHIHAHHGYFGSWIAMIAARLLNVGFSFTLHGSDLLLHASHLALKLENCSFCLTVSEFNRAYILEHFPEIPAGKILVSRLGVPIRNGSPAPVKATNGDRFSLLAVGRLHAVKDHAFLVRACVELQTHGVGFECSIAGDGPERKNLESLIRQLGLENRVTLLGHVAHEQTASLYARADVVVLTSRSEGIPLVLMEAMAAGKIVLAPAITGIPELVVPGKTGFLYEPGSLADFVDRLLSIRALLSTNPPVSSTSFFLSAARPLDRIRHAAQVQVRHNFNRGKNLDSFCDLFLARITPSTESLTHANFVLQQI